MPRRISMQLTEARYSPPLINPQIKILPEVNIGIPLPYSSDFEGERIRRENLKAEFGGGGNAAFEILISRGENEVEDGRVELIGPDIDELVLSGRTFPLAILVSVYGRRMQVDFEPVLERQIHRFINYAKGVVHDGQRANNRLSVNHEAFGLGFRMRDLGIILCFMLHKEYAAVIDKVQVSIYTRECDVKDLLVEANKVFERRDERLNGMADESVDTYYSCLICQSITPKHVCIITPEKMGICGAYSWLDAKVAFEVTPTGPNYPILKGRALNLKLGQWKSVNEFVKNNSNKAIERVSLYSLINSPQSSCGYFECIISVIPEANGVMALHRSYAGLTPSGMNFSALSELIERGVQTPGVLGVSKRYILSKKFISAEGGLRRLVWMPKELKEILGDKLKKAVYDIGEPGLLEKIADERVATTADELSDFLKKVKHPAIGMAPII